MCFPLFDSHAGVQNLLLCRNVFEGVTPAHDEMALLETDVILFLTRHNKAGRYQGRNTATHCCQSVNPI